MGEFVEKVVAMDEISLKSARLGLRDAAAPKWHGSARECSNRHAAVRGRTLAVRLPAHRRNLLPNFRRSSRISAIATTVFRIFSHIDHP